MTQFEEARELIYSPEEQAPIILSLQRPWNSTVTNHDTITDFVHLVDIIDTSAITEPYDSRGPHHRQRTGGCE